MYALTKKRIWVAGHRGMVGSAVVRRLQREDCTVLTAGREEVDLLDGTAVRRWMAEVRPQAIVMAAAKVGGILANDTYPVDFLHNNLAIATNITAAAHEFGVEKMLSLGSSCIYPRLAPQPIVESSLLTVPLEPTNQWYAIAKIAGIMLCQAYRKQYGCDFISAMPTNLYGPNDNFDLLSSHVLPALLVKAHRAREQRAPEMPVWGSGQPRREFLHVDDLADALVFLLQHYSEMEHINIGYGDDVTIRELAETVCDTVGFQGHLSFDSSKPDGTPRKLMDSSRLNAMGWRPSIALRDGLRSTYEWYLANVSADAQAQAN